MMKLVCICEYAVSSNKEDTIKIFVMRYCSRTIEVDVISGEVRISSQQMRI